MSRARRLTVLLLALPALLAWQWTLAGQANAAMTVIGNDQGKTVYVVCKTAQTGGFGPVWRITLVMATQPDWSGRATFLVWRKDELVQKVQLKAANGSWDVRTTFASRILPDVWQTDFHSGQISTGSGLGSGLGGRTSFSQMATC